MQTLFYIKTFIFEYKQNRSRYLITNTTKLYYKSNRSDANGVLYQNIYIRIQTKFYIKTFIFECKLCFILKHLYSNANKVLYQNIYIRIQTKPIQILNNKHNKTLLQIKSFGCKLCFILKHLYSNTNKVLYQNICI